MSSISIYKFTIKPKYNINCHKPALTILDFLPLNKKMRGFISLTHFYISICHNVFLLISNYYCQFTYISIPHFILFNLLYLNYLLIHIHSSKLKSPDFHQTYLILDYYNQFLSCHHSVVFSYHNTYNIV